MTASHCNAQRRCCPFCPVHILISALSEQSLCTLGTSCEEYLTGFQLPSDSERIHASIAASLFFCASSTYLQQITMYSEPQRASTC